MFKLVSVSFTYSILWLDSSNVVVVLLYLCRLILSNFLDDLFGLVQILIIPCYLFLPLNNNLKILVDNCKPIKREKGIAMILHLKKDN